MRHVPERVFGAQRDGVHQVENVGLGVGIERQQPALLDHGARQRIGERPLGHDQRLRLASGGLPGIVGGLQRQLDRAAGPDMLGQVLDGPGRIGLAAAAGHGKRHVRSAVKRARIRSLGLGQREIGLGGCRAVVVGDPIVQLHGAVGGTLGVAREVDLRRLVGNNRKGPAAQVRLARLQRQRAVAVEPANELTRRRQGRAGCGCGRLFLFGIDGAGDAVLARIGQRLVAGAASDAQRDGAASDLTGLRCASRASARGGWTGVP